jgi:hypothetical protein
MTRLARAKRVFSFPGFVFSALYIRPNPSKICSTMMIDFVPTPEPGREFDPMRNAADDYENDVQTYVLPHQATVNYMMDDDEHPPWPMPWEHVFERSDGSKYYWDPIEEIVTWDNWLPPGGLHRIGQIHPKGTETVPAQRLRIATEEELATFRRRRAEYGIMWRAFIGLRDALLFCDDDDDGDNDQTEDEPVAPDAPAAAAEMVNA